MFRLLINGDRLAKTFDEKAEAINRTRRIMNSELHSELFNKAKIYAIKGEYSKTLKVFEELYSEVIGEEFILFFEQFFDNNDIQTKFKEWENYYKKWGYHGFWSNIGQDIFNQVQPFNRK